VKIDGKKGTRGHREKIEGINKMRIIEDNENETNGIRWLDAIYTDMKANIDQGNK
jgi:hypothetical protein